MSLVILLKTNTTDKNSDPHDCIAAGHPKKPQDTQKLRYCSPGDLQQLRCWAPWDSQVLFPVVLKGLTSTTHHRLYYRQSHNIRVEDELRKKRNELLENMKVREWSLKSCLVRYRKMGTDPNATNTQDLLLTVVKHLENKHFLEIDDLQRSRFDYRNPLGTTLRQA